MSPMRRACALFTLPLAQTSLLLGVNTLAAGGLGFLFWSIAARLLPAAEVGRASAYTAGIGLVVALAALGLPETLIRHLAHSARPRSLIKRMGQVSVAAGLLAGLFYAVLPVSDALASIYRPLAAVGITVALLLLGLANAVLLAERRPVAILAGSVATGVAKCAALLVAMNAAGVIGAYGLGALLGFALAAAIAARGLPDRSEKNGDTSLSLRGYALSNWIGGAASLLPLAITPSLLLARAGAESAAYATIPLLLLTFLTLSPSVVARSLFAEASRHPERTDLLFRRGMTLAFAGSLAALGGTLVFGRLVLSFFGPDYADAGSLLLVLLAIASLIAVPNYFIDAVLNVRRDTTGYAVVNSAGSVAVAGAVLLLAHDPTSLGVAWIVGQAIYLLIAATTLIIRTGGHHD